MTENEVRISFGIIVLNGEPFTKYCLRSIYNFAHEIIIVEGATENAKAISTHDGHSIDSTLKSIHEFIRDEDKDKKIKLITKNGYWQEKNEMSEAYALAATGNYLWQVDIDEFYLEEDLKKIISILNKDASITSMSFKTVPFWGGINYFEEGPILGDFHRLFKFGPGYKYINHRPPTVIDTNNNNLRNINWLSGTTMFRRYKIRMYHYYLVFPLQAKAKATYYSKTFNKDYSKWLNNNYINFKDPYHVNDNFWKISWLRKYKGHHPQQIIKMMEDIRTKKINIDERNDEDIKKLLETKTYIFKTFLLRVYFKISNFCKQSIKKILILIGVLKRI